MHGLVRRAAAVAICAFSGWGGSAYAQLGPGEDIDTTRLTLPITLRVSGDWGDYQVTCDQPMAFAERVTTTGELYVQASAGWGVFEAGYTYLGDVSPPAIRRYLDENPDDGATVFVSGDMLLGPACDLDSIIEPDVEQNPIFAELDQLNLACSDALVIGVLTSPNGPVPAVCKARDELLAEIGQRAGVADLDPEMLQQCTVEIGLGASTGQPPSEACIAFMEARAQQAEQGFGLCDLAEPPKARLRIIDPRPASFAARYTHDYQRFDCKRFRVEAFINTDPPDYFDLVGVTPTPDECLSVEFMQPTFQVRFDNDLLDQNWDDLVRLQTVRGITEFSVPLNVVQSGPRRLDITPQSPLEPFTSYTLALRVEQDGMRSVDFEELRISDLIVPARGAGAPLIEGAFRSVTWFTTMPFSDLLETPEPPVQLTGGVYQVSRDAYLIRERPTATRIWWDWAPDISGLEGREPRFCAEFDALDTDTQAPVYEPKSLMIRPTADYDDDDKLYARDSANLFNWRPTPDVQDLTLRMRPSNYYVDPDGTRQPPAITAPHDIRVIGNSPLRMTFKYAYLQILDFEEGVSVDAQNLMAQHMQAARRYAWQMGPFGKVSVENLGATTAQGLGLTMPDDPVDSIKEISGAAAQAFALQHCTQTDEVCFIFMPPALRFHRDVSSSETGRGIFVSSAIVGLTSAFVDTPDEGDPARAWLKQQRYIGNGGDLAHEVGHSFGLYHIPKRVDGSDDFMRFHDTGGRFPGIDGVRMRLDGTNGTFKSSETGNPENLEKLAPLLFPSVLPTGAGHTTLNNYNLWLQNAYLRGSTIYGFEYRDDEFTGNDDPPLPENSQRYADAAKEFVSSRLTFLSGTRFDTPESPFRTVGKTIEPGQESSGVAVHLTSRNPSGQMHVDVVQMPRRTRAVPQVPSLREWQTPVTLTGFVADRVVAAVTFGLRADGNDRAQVFLPVPSTEFETLTHLRLTDDQGNALWDYEIPTPVAPQNVKFEMRSSTGLLTWTAGQTALPVVVSFEKSDGTRRSIGSSEDIGTFEFDLAQSGLTGTGVFTLSVDNGLTQATAALPATVTSPFGVLTKTQQGTALRPEAIVTMNRNLETELPDFAVFNESQLVDVSVMATAVDDTLYLAPGADLDPCATYQIRSDQPLRDETGGGTSDVLTIALITADPLGDCPGAIIANQATLKMIRGGTVEESVGEVVFDPASNSVRLTYPRMVLVLSADDWSEGRYGMAALERGETRNELVLRYDRDATGDGSLQIEVGENGPQVTFTATLRGGDIAGTFVFPSAP